MAGGEDQPQEVVTDNIVESGVDLFGEFIGRDFVLKVEVLRELKRLAGGYPLMTQMIQCLAFGSGHQPGARVLRYAIHRPVFQRGNQGFLGEFFGQADVTDDARDPADDFGRFEMPDGLDGLPGRCGTRAGHCAIQPLAAPGRPVPRDVRPDPESRGRT